MYICGNLTCSPVLCKVLCTNKRETSGQCTVLGGARVSKHPGFDFCVSFF